jgi:hypothetical protein
MRSDREVTTWANSIWYDEPEGPNNFSLFNYVVGAGTTTPRIVYRSKKMNMLVQKHEWLTLVAYVGNKTTDSTVIYRFWYTQKME